MTERGSKTVPPQPSSSLLRRRVAAVVVALVSIGCADEVTSPDFTSDGSVVVWTEQATLVAGETPVMLLWNRGRESLLLSCATALQQSVGSRWRTIPEHTGSCDAIWMRLPPDSTVRIGTFSLPETVTPGVYRLIVTEFAAVDETPMPSLTAPSVPFRVVASPASGS